MSTPNTSNPADLPKKHQPFVPETMEMKEFTLRAVLLGLVMTVILGAANAYLGLRAGITIAATYPAAVIFIAGMPPREGCPLLEKKARTARAHREAGEDRAKFHPPPIRTLRVLPAFLDLHRLL